MEGNTSTDEVHSPSGSALSAKVEKDLRVPCYCEENVWRLAYRKLQGNKGNDAKDDNNKQYYAVFISNPSKCVCFFYQRARSNPLSPVFWDYHVLLLEHDTQSKETLVLDVDTYLPYPCPLTDYLKQAFPDPAANADHIEELERVAPFFRVIPADVFLRHFASDRRHMFDAAKKRWLAPPPPYHCIYGINKLPTAAHSSLDQNGKGKANDDNTPKDHNLMTYIDMTDNKDDPIFGCVLTRQQLEEKFQ